MTSPSGITCVQPEGIMKISLHRASVAVATVAVTAGLALFPTATQAAVPTPQAAAAAAWLADQVPSSTHLFESVYGDGEFDKFVDYGLNLDLQYALETLGESATADAVYDAVVDDTAAYTDAFGTRYSGAVGKLATYVKLHGDNPASIDGRNLITDLEGLMVTTGDETGRLKDSPDCEYQSANTVGQAWGVRALAGADSEDADEAAAFLADQQCSDGGFRLYQVDDTCESGVDATAFAITALKEAGGYTDEVADAVDFLLDEQAANGSLTDAEAANSNSTALAASVFAKAGNATAATKAADWIVPLQATAASTPGLVNEVGAIAYGPTEFAAGKTSGITAIKRDQWVRTSVQAALALAYATQPEPEPEPGPVASLQLTSSKPTPTQGDTITISATGKDAEGVSNGDVSDDLTLTSSVDTDTVVGNTVKFNHASPHTITATHTPTGTTAQITIEVSPLADAGGGDGGSGGGSGGADAGDALPDTGSTFAPWQLAVAAGVIVLGAALIIGARRRTAPAHADR